MKIITGKLDSAQRVVIYGPEGIGKSSLAAQFPGSVFIDLESGTHEMDVPRTESPSSWAMLIRTIEKFTADNYGFSTLVIDTADAAERLCREHVCAKAEKESIEDFGYGVGFTRMSETWAQFLDSLFVLRDKGMNVVIISHAHLRKFEQPDDFGRYDRYEMKLTKQIAPMTKEWADMVLFINYETIVITDDKTKVTKAAGGKRVIHTEHHVCWDAKNRHDLPPRIEFKKGVPLTAIMATLPKAHAASATKAVEAPVKPKAAEPKLKPETKPETKPEPTQKPEPKPEKEVTQEADPSAFHPALYDLMSADGITAEEVQAIVAKRGYFPADTPMHNYPKDFVNGSLVACWPQVKGMIIKNRN